VWAKLLGEKLRRWRRELLKKAAKKVHEPFYEEPVQHAIVV
jgi:hypothetical protein